VTLNEICHICKNDEITACQLVMAAKKRNRRYAHKLTTTATQNDGNGNLLKT
jgi:hypothetical protein